MNHILSFLVDPLSIDKWKDTEGKHVKGKFSSFALDLRDTIALLWRRTHNVPNRSPVLCRVRNFVAQLVFSIANLRHCCAGGLMCLGLNCCGIDAALFSRHSWNQHLCEYHNNINDQAQFYQLCTQVWLDMISGCSSP